jgi:hypothetical protein
LVRTGGADADSHANAENEEGREVTAGVDADRTANIERERDGWLRWRSGRRETAGLLEWEKMKCERRNSGWPWAFAWQNGAGNHSRRIRDRASISEESRQTSAGWGQIKKDQNEFSNRAWKILAMDGIIREIIKSRLRVDDQGTAPEASRISCTAIEFHILAFFFLMYPMLLSLPLSY